MRVVLVNQPMQPRVQVVAGRGIGILLDDQAGGGVLEKDSAEPVADLGLDHGLPNLAGDFVQARARAGDRKPFDHSRKNIRGRLRLSTFPNLEGAAVDNFPILGKLKNCPNYIRTL